MISAAAGWLILVAGLVWAQPAQGPLQVTLYRTWVPPNATVVDGLFRVDGQMLGMGAACVYDVTLLVEDSAGTPLVTNEWEGRCPPPQDGRPFAALETFQFAVVPAQYTVRVTVEPKGRPEGRISTRIPLESLTEGVMVSDLILARKAGWIEGAGDIQWTIRRGELGLAAASEAVAEETNPNIAYYMELYPRPGKPVSGTLKGMIRRPDGMQIAEMRLQTIESATEARPVAGNLSLAGLAPGEYVLETRLELADTVLVRTHAFRMIGRSFAAEAPQGDTGWFGSLSDERLAELFDPVEVTLQRQSERDLFSRLNPDGRRRFLVQYFGVPGPAAEGEPKNPLDLYLDRVEYVNRNFSGRGGEPGWRNDRGRIHLLRGEPQAKVSRPLPPVGAAPYEIWQYTAAPGYAYVFVDESRIGSYRLIWSSDPNESSLPDWDRRLSSDAIDEMMRLGIRPRGGG